MATKKTSYSKVDIEKIKENLIIEKARIEKELGTLPIGQPTETSERDGSFHDIGDEVDDNVHELEDYAVNKSIEMNTEGALRDIKKSLDRIEKGTYGICKYCDNEIDIKRLTARPTSSSCVSCKKTLTDEA